MIKHNSAEEQKKRGRKRHWPIGENENDLSRNLEFVQQEIKVEA